jgi:hypothetical protein
VVRQQLKAGCQQRIKSLAADACAADTPGWDAWLELAVPCIKTCCFILLLPPLLLLLSLLMLLLL